MSGEQVEDTERGNVRVAQLRLAVTAGDYDQALRFYRDVLGMPEVGTFEARGGHVTILDAGQATLELADPTYAAYIDEVEVGQRVAGHIRVASRSLMPQWQRRPPRMPELAWSHRRPQRRGTHRTHGSKRRRGYRSRCSLSSAIRTDGRERCYIGGGAGCVALVMWRLRAWQ